MVQVMAFWHVAHQAQAVLHFPPPDVFCLPGGPPGKMCVLEEVWEPSESEVSVDDGLCGRAKA